MACESTTHSRATNGRIIYAIVATATGETIYIGKATDIADRWRGHRNALLGDRHGNGHLQRWFNKRGRDLSHITIQLIELCDHNDAA